MFRVCIALLTAAFTCAWTLRADQLVTISNVLGPIVIHLFETDKPVTAGNFLKYVNSGAYTDTFVQRWEPGFVIQGGGWKTTNVNNQLFLDDIPTFGQITNEYSVGRNYPNTFGTIAMARNGDPTRGETTNSASSQWFINLSDRNTFLDKVDGGFTVFGRVVGGTNVVNLFNNAPDNNLSRIVINNSLNLGKVPYFVPADSLVYTAFSVRQDFGQFDAVLQMEKVAGEAVLKWTTIKDKPHVLESTDTLPPQWKPLTNFTGDGSAFKLTNSVTANRLRFFRMRVDLQ